MDLSEVVTPLKNGVQTFITLYGCWIPASAGMTEKRVL